jgi:hypothetical protein
LVGAIWLAWQGLIRKRATRTIEGTLWMVVAGAATIALIGKPADFTGVSVTYRSPGPSTKTGPGFVLPGPRQSFHP